MAQPQSVTAGQRYIKSYKLSSDCTEWEVLSVRAVGETLLHAQLVNCRDPFDMRTVSCAEIVGGGAFDLAEEGVDYRRRARQIASRVNRAVGYRQRLKRLVSDINQAVRSYKTARRQSLAPSSTSAGS